MSEKYTLEASVREVVGKKVKQLRRQGIVPGVIYGPEFEAMSIAVDHKLLRQVLLQAGGTQLIELTVDGMSIPTLAREVQRDPIVGDILHVDFYRVAMDRPIRAAVPLQFVGESPAADTTDTVLVHPLASIEIEALPANLPPHIEVDLSLLTAVGAQILVGDLVLPRQVTLHTDPGELVAKLDYQAVLPEEEEELVAAVEGEEEPEVIKKGRGEEEEE